MASTELSTNGGFQGDRYFSRAWSLLTHDKGWIKPVLVMSVADLVPVAGPLGTLGYKLEWARLLAWGADVSPKQKNVQVGACIASGWRGFLVFLGWGIVMALIGGILGAVPLLGGLLGTLWSIFGLYLSMVLRADAVRATIYQKAGAGYSAKNLLELGRRDAGGLLRIVGSKLLVQIVVSIVAGLAVMVTAMGALPRIIMMVQDISYYSYGYSEYYAASLAIQLVAYLISAFGPTLIVLLLLGLVVNTVLSMLVYASLGLWMRQFDVPAWGRSEDPLPGAAPAAEKGDVPVMPTVPAAAPAEPAAPVATPAPADPAASAAPVAPFEYAPDGSEVIEVEPIAQAPEPKPSDQDFDAPAQD